ncbi:MAG: DUF1573 domain-containing protein [Planctomycetota bacterium]
MKFTVLLIAAAAVGCGLGVAMAYVSLGPLDGDQLAAPAPIARVAAPEPAPRSGPSARLDSASHDFGVMQLGAKRSHTFVMHNDGASPLVLTTGETSCKCTSFTAGDGPVPPGGSVEINLEWIAKSLAGPFRQTANLSTNDPNHPQFVLTVEGQVVEASGLFPKEFRLNRMSVDETRELVVDVLAFDQQTLEVVADPPTRPDGVPNDAYSVAVTPLAREDFPEPTATAGKRVTLTVRPGLPIGRVLDWVTLRTNLPTGDETIQVPVVGRVEGDLSIRGAGWSAETGVLSLGIVKNSVGYKRNLLVSVKGPNASEAELSVAEIDPPELAVALGEPRRVRAGVVHFPLAIEVPKGTRPMVRLNNGLKGDGTYAFPEGRVRLASTLPSTPGIELRVRFAVEDDSP